jgi:hypothetical protein
MVDLKSAKGSIWFKASRIFLLLLIAFFIGKTIDSNWEEIKGYPWDLDLWFLLLSLLIIFLHNLTLSIAWQRLVILTGEKLSVKAALRITTLSAVARYLPGGVWGHVGKFALAKRDYGLEGKRTFLSVVLHLVFAVLTAVITFLASLIFFSSYQDLKFLPYLTALIIPGLIIIYPPLLEKMLNLVLRKLKKEELEIPFSYSQILKSTLWFFSNWLMVGAALFALINAVSPTNITLFPAIAGIYAVSWAVGFLTPLAPNGAGVREASLIVLLGAAIPPPVAIISTISFRLLIVTRDVLSALIGTRIPKGQ